jgi:NAD(P)H-dependent FMN reductase
MTAVKTAIIVGSTRPSRLGRGVAEWVLGLTTDRPGASYDLVDLAEVGLPLLDEPLPSLLGQYANPHTIEWARTVAPYDGFVFVTPEYNHSTSPALLNALDYIYAEWNNKAAAFVSYGSSEGVRAVEHLRSVATEVQLAHVREQIKLSLYTDFVGYVTLAPAEEKVQSAPLLFDQLESWARALRGVREELAGQ